MITATRYHDISCGHRVVGHESKCRHLHGHNYRVHFTLRGDLDSVGRVLDFSIIKSRLCVWLETHWDHKFLVAHYDTLFHSLFNSYALPGSEITDSDAQTLAGSIVWVPFNPTAENMASYLLNTVGPCELQGTGAELIKVIIEETSKCSAGAEK